MPTHFHNFFTVKFRKDLSEKGRIITTASPQICCHTTLRNTRGQVYSFTAQLIQFKVMKNN